MKRPLRSSLSCCIFLFRFDGVAMAGDGVAVGDVDGGDGVAVGDVDGGGIVVGLGLLLLLLKFGGQSAYMSRGFARGLGPVGIYSLSCVSNHLARAAACLSLVVSGRAFFFFFFVFSFFLFLRLAASFDVGLKSA